MSTRSGIGYYKSSNRNIGKPKNETSKSNSLKNVTLINKPRLPPLQNPDSCTIQYNTTRESTTPAEYEGALNTTINDHRDYIKFTNPTILKTIIECNATTLASSCNDLNYLLYSIFSDYKSTREDVFKVTTSCKWWLIRLIILYSLEKVQPNLLFDLSNEVNSLIDQRLHNNPVRPSTPIVDGCRALKDIILGDGLKSISCGFYSLFRNNLTHRMHDDIKEAGCSEDQDSMGKLIDNLDNLDERSDPISLCVYNLDPTYGNAVGNVSHFFSIFFLNGQLYLNSSFGSDYIKVTQRTTPLDMEEFVELCDFLSKNNTTPEGECVSIEKDEDLEKLKKLFNKYFGYGEGYTFSPDAPVCPYFEGLKTPEVQHTPMSTNSSNSDSDSDTPKVPLPPSEEGEACEVKAYNVGCHYIGIIPDFCDKVSQTIKSLHQPDVSSGGKKNKTKIYRISRRKKTRKNKRKTKRRRIH
jgi:hypothetical protein